MEANVASVSEPREASGHKVTSLELFFDLVFVLAFTQVTAKLAQDLTWHGLFRSLLVLAVLWWAWGAFAWLTNAFDPESRLMRLPIFVAMGALLVAALAVPQAFGEEAFVFVAAYFIVRMIHISLYLVASRHDRAAFAAVLKLSPAMFLAPLILLISAAFDGETQAAIWILAIVVDYGGAFFLVGDGWNVESEHFAERYGLIVIIALGESIVSIGVGATNEELTAKVIGSATLAIALTGALWWMYFDVVALVAARKLREAGGEARARMARDSYSYLHYFLIAGVVLLALAIKKTIAHPYEHLEEIPAVALCLGLASYAFGLSAIKRRNVGTWNWQRLFVGALFIALIPAAEKLPSLATLAIAFAILAILISFEATIYWETRLRIRSERD
jgi:low temperature requirement protein LtrA